jgi:GMP synthase (glutamine-hydrolysing)
MSENLRFLVVDGYVKKARDELAAGGAMVAGPLYAEMLKRYAPGADCDVIYPSDPGAAMPKGKALAVYDGVAWTGCSLTIFDDIPEVRAQIEFARAVYDAGIPSFGSCWAAQIAVVAAGGAVAANPKGREMGIARKIALTPAGRAHPLYGGKADVFDGFISHYDEVTELPPGAERLAGNAFTHVQAVSVKRGDGEFWGLQYHPEYDLHEMARLVYCRIDRLIKDGFFKDRKAGEDYVTLMETLHADPRRKDVAWLLGVDEDIMDPKIRCIEVVNWLDRLVKPTAAKRR